eukprot:148781_1
MKAKRRVTIPIIPSLLQQFITKIQLFVMKPTQKYFKLNAARSHLLRKWNISQLLTITLLIIVCFFLVVSMLLNRSQLSRSEFIESEFYLFGYGSLINEASRKETGITGNAIPVRVHHMRRGWIYDVDLLHHPTLSNTPYTAVGVQIDHDHFESTTNGVLFPLHKSEIEKYDAREARYERYRIDLKDIEYLQENVFVPSNSVVYVYVVPQDIVLDDNSTRILKQSYIDKFLAGCLEMEDLSFAVECIETTHSWNGMYQNDRNQSLFSKEKISTQVKEQIDDLIDTHLPQVRY